MFSTLMSGFEFFMTFLGYFIPFLFVLALVVFIHELGHFLVGRWCGVKVETFSLGFGPRLLAFHDRKGTEWAISAIPLGGYVKFKGDADAASTPDHQAAAAMNAEDRKDAFPHKAVWQRSLIVAAGPAANFVLAFVIFAASFMFIGRTMFEPVIGGVVENSVAASKGIERGDRIISINGVAMESFDDVLRRISIAENEELRIVLQRGNREIEVVAVPAVTSNKTILGTDRRPVMGIKSSELPEHRFVRKFGPVEASVTSVREIIFVIDRTAHYIGGLIAGREKADQLSGPLRIGYISGKVWETGLAPLLILAGILSISIGIINLLPIPMLDGGHLVFYAIEAVFGKQVSPRAQEISFRIGFAAVIMLMLFSTWNDVTHLTGLAFR